MEKILYISLYSISYGMYENLVVYHNTSIVNYITKYGNWSIMWGLFSIICVILKMTFVEILYYILWFSTCEDIVFFICDWFTLQKYPYPVGNWYDEQFPLFKIFHLGKSDEFLPYFPRFYFITLAICSIYFTLNFIKSRLIRRNILNKLISVFSMIVLSPLYVLIIGSIMVPSNISYTNATIIFTSVISIIYIFEVYCSCLYMYKRIRTISITERLVDI